MFVFSKRVMEFASRHVVSSNAAHAAGGFGLALLLQYYIVGIGFLPVSVGWVLIALAALWHFWVWTAVMKPSHSK